MARRVRSVLRLGAGCLLCLLPGLALASDPPDSAVNPRSGIIETADSHWAGAKFLVRHAIHAGRGQSPVVFEVSGIQDDDPEPRLAIGPTGDTWVLWRRSVPSNQVLVRKRTYSTSAWSAERVVSASGQDAVRPRIVCDGTSPWVAYLATTTSGTAIATVRIIDDGPDPFGPLLVATTSYAGDLDMQLNAEAGHLWVTWVDGAATVGWSAYDYGTGTWTLPAYESYTGDSDAAARNRIAATVLGG